MRHTFVSILLLLMVENSLLNKTTVWGDDAVPQRDSRDSTKDNIDMPGTYRSGLWEYQVVVTSPGSKSEGTRGRLLYAGKPVDEPGRGDYYRTPWGEIQWNGDSELLWGDHGWMPRMRGSRHGRELPEPWHLAGGPMVMGMVLRDAEEFPKDESLATWVKAEIQKHGAKGFAIVRPWFPLGEQAVTIHDTKLEGRLTARLCPARDATTLTIALEGSEPARVNLSRKDGTTGMVLRKVGGPLSDSVNYYLAFRVDRAAPQWPNALDIGPESDGKVVVVKGAKEVVIGLPGDLHSGCMWTVKRAQGVTAVNSSVTAGGKPQFVSALGAAAGAVHRGVFENVLRVTGPGKSYVELEYGRDWQTDRPAEKTYTVTLDVQEEPVRPNKP